MGSCPLSPWSRAGVLLTWLSAQVPSPRYSSWWRLIMTRGYLACWTSACIPCLIQEQMTSKCSPVFLLSPIPPTWTRLCLFLSHWPVVDHIKFLKYDLGSSSWCHQHKTSLCFVHRGRGGVMSSEGTSQIFSPYSEPLLYPSSDWGVLELWNWLSKIPF